VPLTSFTHDQKNFDSTRPSFFRFYGKETRVEPHPCLAEEWSTTFRKTYLDPRSRTKPNAFQRKPVKAIEFDDSVKEATRKSTVASGFQANAQLQDETSWKTEQNLHTDIVRTEYRNRYNQPKPFHKTNVLNSHGRLKKREAVYDLMDKYPSRFWRSKAGDSNKYAPRQTRVSSVV
jgi:hypothetical protein